MGFLGRRIIFALLLAGLCIPTLAEFPPETFPDTPKRPREKVVRQTIPEEAPPGPPFPMRFRFMGMLGLSSLSTDDAASDLLISQYEIKHHLGGSLNAELQFMKHFGVEADLFYATTPTMELFFESDGRLEWRRMMHWGAMGHVRFEYPIVSGAFTFRPRLGVGYGLVHIAQFNGTSGGHANFDANVSGLYVVLGAEVLWGPWVVLLDYSLSLGAGGSYKSAGIPGEFSESIAGGGFTRLRLAALHEIWKGVSLGAIFALRGIKVPNSHAADATKSLYFGHGESVMQILGVGALEF